MRRAGNEVITDSSLQGAIASELKHFQFQNDDMLHIYRGQLPTPTEKFPDGTSFKQIMSTGTKKGERFYRNGLKNSGASDGSPIELLSDSSTSTLSVSSLVFFFFYIDLSSSF